jgi:hypothetical protein
MPSAPEFSPAVRSQMEEVVAQAVSTFLTEFTGPLFPNHTSAAAQDCVVGGLALAIARYQAHTGRPIAQALSLALVDLKD